MFGEEESISPRPMVPCRLNLKQPRELGKKISIPLTLAGLPCPIHNMTIRLYEVLARLRDDNRGGRRKTHGFQRDESTSNHSSPS